jgi:uncharacterized protein (TIGR02996 family)
MSERQDFVRAICAAPEDDAPRLVFADWCDENGEGELAEFIRVQIAISKLTDADYDPFMHPSRNPQFIGCQDKMANRDRYGRPCRACDLRKRERALFCDRTGQYDGGGHWFDWFDIRIPQTTFRRDGTVLTFLDGSRRGHRLKAEFCRGFPTTILAYTNDFIDHAAQMFRNYPITAVVLVDREPGTFGPDYPGGEQPTYPFVWRNMGQGWVDESSLVPTDIFRLLLPAVSGLRCYETEHDANKDLSAACVRYGRLVAYRSGSSPAKLYAGSLRS